MCGWVRGRFDRFGIKYEAIHDADGRLLPQTNDSRNWKMIVRASVSYICSAGYVWVDGEEEGEAGGPDGPKAAQRFAS